MVDWTVFSPEISPVRASERTYTDYGTLDYKFANDVRTFVTFDFDEGIERIEFPFFEITSGFNQKMKTMLLLNLM